MVSLGSAPATREGLVITLPHVPLKWRVKVRRGCRVGDGVKCSFQSDAIFSVRASSENLCRPIANRPLAYRASPPLFINPLRSDQWAVCGLVRAFLLLPAV